MSEYMNIITKKIVTATNLDNLPGNIVNRGLSHEFIKLDSISLEYNRLVQQLKTINFGVGYNNTLKGIRDMRSNKWECTQK